MSLNKVVEFAGYLIRKDGIHKGIKPSLKPDSLSTFVNYCEVMNKVPRALEHLDVLVPLTFGLEEHGGPGINPLRFISRRKIVFGSTLLGERTLT
jgi:hypothetical protein